MVERFDWKIRHVDPTYGPSDYKLINATKWEAKKEMARRIRALRSGFGSIPGTELPQHIEEKTDGRLIGWCDAPYVGHVTFEAKIVKRRTKAFEKLASSDKIDICNSRFGIFLPTEKHLHRYHYTGMRGPTVTIRQVML